MKRALAIVAVATLAACTTVKQDKLTTVIVRDAAAEVLRSKPEYRPAFVASVAALDLVLQNPTASTQQLESALRGLKIKELKGGIGAMRVADILDAIDIALSDKPVIGAESRLRSFIVAVHEGMRQGLIYTALPPPAPPAPAP